MKHYPTYLAYRFIEVIIHAFPMRVNCIVGGALGNLGHALMTKKRLLVHSNLRTLLGDTTNFKKTSQLTKSCFKRSGANFLGGIKTSSLSQSELHESIDLQGEEEIDFEHNNKHGSIFLLAHMGNWEILSHLHKLIPKLNSTAAIYRELDNPLVDQFIKSRREQQGGKLFSRSRGYSKPITHLKEGGTLCVLADQNAGASGVQIPLCRNMASVSPLPALLQRRTQATIYPVSVQSLSTGRWRFQIHPGITYDQTTKPSTRTITQLCAESLENIFLTSPADVLWMHRYWRISLSKPLRPLHASKINQNHLSASPAPSRVLLHIPYPPPPDLDSALDFLTHQQPNIEITVFCARETEKLIKRDFQTIAYDVSDPPTVRSAAIKKFDHAMPQSWNFAIDLCPHASGAASLNAASISHICGFGASRHLHNKTPYPQGHATPSLHLFEQLGCHSTTTPHFS